MPALQWSRRRLLSASAVAVAGIVGGCNAGRDEASDTPYDPRSGPPDGAITDVESVSLRRDDPDPFVGLDDEINPVSIDLLVDQSDADALVFEPEPSGAEDILAWVKTTDFERQSVAIVQKRLGACYRRHVEYVLPAEDDFHAEFCRVLRDADVACGANDRDMVATVLRFPFAYDREPSSVGTGGGGSCERVLWEDTPTGEAG